MTTNYFPCPIPAGSSSHIYYRKRKSVQDILDMIKNRPKPAHDAAGFVLLDTSLKMYNRLFKKFRRYIPLKPKKQFFYAIMNPQMNHICTVKTKAKAMSLLKQDEIDYMMFDEPINPTCADTRNGIYRRNKVPPGSIIIKVAALGSRMNIDHSKYDVGTSDPDYYKFRVAAKKCPTCPRLKDPSSLQCGCSLISYIKDGTPGYAFLSDHQILMKKHKDRKNPKETITISLKDL